MLLHMNNATRVDKNKLHMNCDHFTIARVYERMFNIPRRRTLGQQPIASPISSYISDFIVIRLDLKHQSWQLEKHVF
jgi:hypothetical protein